MTRFQIQSVRITVDTRKRICIQSPVISSVTRDLHSCPFFNSPCVNILHKPLQVWLIPILIGNFNDFCFGFAYQQRGCCLSGAHVVHPHSSVFFSWLATLNGLRIILVHELQHPYKVPLIESIWIFPVSTHNTTIPKKLSSDYNAPQWINTPWHPSSFDLTHVPSLQFGWPWSFETCPVKLSGACSWSVFSHVWCMCYQSTNATNRSGQWAPLQKYLHILQKTASLFMIYSVRTTLMRITLIFHFWLCRQKPSAVCESGLIIGAKIQKHSKKFVV